MVLYAHGMPIGQISESSEDSFNQATLITCVKKQDFKLAKLYLMQCYSGYQGNVSILWNELDKFIETRKSKEPEKYKGDITTVATIVRIAVTGRANTPDLWSIVHIMGEEQMKQRIEKVINR